MNTASTSLLLLALTRLQDIASYDQAASPHSRAADPANFINPSRVTSGISDNAENHSDFWAGNLNPLHKTCPQTAKVPASDAGIFSEAAELPAYSNHSLQDEYVKHIFSKYGDDPANEEIVRSFISRHFPLAG